MKVIIARHAETSENVKEINIGRDVDPLLTDIGKQQAKKLADFLKKEDIHFVYISPQKRAVHTAQEVLKHHPGAKVAEIAHLKEQNLGIYESLPKHEWKKIKAKASEPFHLFKPPKGENYVELKARVGAFFDNLVSRHEHDTVFLVSHGSAFGILYLHIFDKEITEENYKMYRPENTAITILEIFKSADWRKTVKVHTLNSLEHLH